jgi:aminocarboxymuconate-semialdehyde decarboxylase
MRRHRPNQLIDQDKLIGRRDPCRCETGDAEISGGLLRKQAADRRPQQTDWRLRLADMDAMGVDIQIVSPIPGQMYSQMPLDVVVKATSIVNDSLAAFVAERPDRFAAIGTVPLLDGHAAAEELARGMLRLGLRGVQVPTNVNGRELSDPAHEPFWAKAEALGAVVFIHPSGFTHPERLSRFYLNNTIGNPLETTIALHTLIMDGVLERHPGLKLIAAHGGAFAAAYSGRMDHAWGARSDAHGELPNPPTTYLKRIHFDTVVFTPHQLDYLVRTFGADHILLGTDYPADMGEYDPLGHLAATETLDPAAISAIAGGNAKRLFGIP